jgi:hydroxypyruvate reductase
MNNNRSAVVNSSAAVEIWNAGVQAAGAAQVVRDSIDVCGDRLSIAGATYQLKRLKKIIVVGFGKCSGAMAAGLESALKELPGVEANGIQLTGLVIVPEGQTASTSQITTTVGRSRASNFPTEAVVQQTQRMLDLIRGAGVDTLIVAMVSGGGSALLERPLVPLSDLIAVSRSLSARGAPIEALNTVRRAISAVKAGGLARHVLENSEASMVGLIISDVIGDALGMVASGPTIISEASVAQQRSAAREVMRQFDLQEEHGWIYRWLEQTADANQPVSSDARIKNLLIANNSSAVDGAEVEARKMRFEAGGVGAAAVAGIDVNQDVDKVAESWVALALGAIEQQTSASQSIAMIAGGEPTVVLCQSPGRGGRNLQLTALVLQKLSQRWPVEAEGKVAIAFVSGGTDGEDGSAPVAGACFDTQMLERLADAPDMQDELERAILANDCDSFFTLHSGRLPPPSISTNVCDLQVMLVGGLGQET